MAGLSYCCLVASFRFKVQRQVFDIYVWLSPLKDQSHLSVYPLSRSKLEAHAVAISKLLKQPCGAGEAVEWLVGQKSDEPGPFI